MIEIRPYQAQDNEINQEMRSILDEYLQKNNEQINEMYIYELSVKVITESNRIIVMTKAEGCRARTTQKRNYFYMREFKNGIWLRIKKSEW